VNQVTLIDGRVVSSWSEEWRAETEARAICNMPTLWDRQQFLIAAEKRRGKEAAEQLRQRVRDMWQHLHKKL
jgi:hypothetical protein